MCRNKQKYVMHPVHEELGLSQHGPGTSLEAGRGAGEPLQLEPLTEVLLVIQGGDRGATNLVLLAILRALLFLSVVLALLIPFLLSQLLGYDG